MCVKRPSRSALVSAVFLIAIAVAPLAIGVRPYLHVQELSTSRLLIASALPLLVALAGYHKKSLSPSACPIVLWFGFVVTLTCGVYSASLIAFFILGSVATKIGLKKKQRLRIFHGTRRDWIQAVCNAGPVALVSVMQYSLMGAGEMPIPYASTKKWLPDFALKPTSSTHSLNALLHLAVLGSLATCAGDTFASELGPVLASSSPVLLVTPWRRVPVGTNGGVTIAGLLCSMLGGLSVGAVDCLTTAILCSRGRGVVTLLLSQMPTLYYGALAGLVGSLIDSLIGATLQYSGLDAKEGIIHEQRPGVKHISGRELVDNNMVNLLSSALMAVVLPAMFFSSLQT